MEQLENRLHLASDLVTGTDTGVPGNVKVFSGANGTELTSFFPFTSSFTGGVRVANADINGDNRADIITGAGSGGLGHVKAFDGVTFTEIRSFLAYGSGYSGGVFVAAGDVNGDGLADIITGTDTGFAPHVKVFSGANGTELASFFAYSPGFTGGVRVSAGDINGDGRVDIITGPGPGTASHVKVIDGNRLGQISPDGQIADSALLASFFAFDPSFTGGVTVAAGDVNGDGKSDIVVGAGPGTGPHVKVIDGNRLGQISSNGQIADSALLASFFAFDPSFTGGVRVAAGDINRDARADIITGTGPGDARVKAFDGATFVEIRNFLPYGAITNGVFVAGHNATTNDKIGIHRGNQFFQDVNGNGVWNGNAGGDRLVSFGNSGDVPLVGDWNGDGFDEVGVKRSNQYYLDANGNGVWNGVAGGDLLFTFGNAGDVPLVGDWDGDGDDQIGVQHGNQFYLDRNSNGVWNGTSGGDLLYAFGNSGDKPVIGDWDGDGDDQIGIHRGSQFYLDRNSNGVWNGVAGGDRLYNFGATGDVPLAGDWNADGTDKIGVKRGNAFYLDRNGNGIWNGTAGGDLLHTFGNPGDRPLDGKWRPGGALLAAGGAAASPSDAAPLTRDALAPILQQAIILWANTGLTSSQLHTLHSVQVVIADLPGAQLGLSLGGTILIDRDAAGYGWFVDPTPDDNSEFSDPQSLIPNPQSLDLLTAVLHELGHELGFDHDDDLEALLETLATGTRLLP